MRKLVIAAAVLIVLAALVLWLSRDERGAVSVAPDTKPTPQANNALSPNDSTPSVTRTVETPTTTPTTLAPSASNGPRSHVFGRVVDEHHTPLADVTVMLRAHSGAWSKSAPLPDIEFNGANYQGVRTTSAIDGAFTFDVPVPTTDRVHLDFAQALYFLLDARTFGRNKEGGNRPAIVAGDNDQGDIVLASAGAVTGRVLTDDGAPLADAKAEVEHLGIGSGFVTRSPLAISDASGTYLLGHLPDGAWKLTLEYNGRLTRDDVDIVVHRGVTTSVADVRLARSPRISGIVVDDEGTPVSNVMMRAWPTQSNSSTSAVTRADGSFAFLLPADEPFSINVEDTIGFEPWQKGKMMHDPARTFEPGRSAVRIVLQRSARTTFRVIDARTQQPIERFAARVVPTHVNADYHGDADAEFVIEAHPLGEVVLPATPHESVVRVRALDHAPLEREVVQDASGVQTLALDPASALDGRLVLDGAPLVDATIFFERELLDAQGNVIEDTKKRAVSIRYDLDPFAGRGRETKSGTDGAFTFAELPAGTWHLWTEHPNAARVHLREVRVPVAGTLHMGDIVVTRGAVVRGRVLTGANDSPGGYVVRMDASSERTQEITRDDGAFEFVGLEAGPHSITWTKQRKVNKSAGNIPTERFELVAGETRTLVLDAIAQAPCTVVAHMTRDGHTVVGLQVFALVKRGAKPTYVLLGVTDADGTASGEIAGGTTFDLIAVSTEGRAIGSGGRDLVAASGTRIERTIDLLLGTLLIELPETLHAPERGCIAISLTADGREPVLLGVCAQNPKVRDAKVPPTGSVWDGRVIVLHDVPAGDFKATLNFFVEPLIGEDKRRTPEPPIRPEYTCSVKIEAGREARIVVP